MIMFMISTVVRWLEQLSFYVDCSSNECILSSLSDMLNPCLPYLCYSYIMKRNSHELGNRRLWFWCWRFVVNSYVLTTEGWTVSLRHHCLSAHLSGYEHPPFNMCSYVHLTALTRTRVWIHFYICVNNSAFVSHYTCWWYYNYWLKHT